MRRRKFRNYLILIVKIQQLSEIQLKQHSKMLQIMGAPKLSPVKKIIVRYILQAREIKMR
jgi:hypothetical protein